MCRYVVLGHPGSNQGRVIFLVSGVDMILKRTSYPSALRKRRDILGQLNMHPPFYSIWQGFVKIRVVSLCFMWGHFW